MSNRLAITINKLHQIGRFAYLTVSGKHRQILKAYKTINGKHELCYVRGVEWKKFSCDRDTYTRYKQDDKNVGNTSTTTKQRSGKTRTIPFPPLPVFLAPEAEMRGTTRWLMATL